MGAFQFLKAALLLVAFVLASPAWAAYADLTPTPGWSSTGSSDFDRLMQKEFKPGDQWIKRPAPGGGGDFQRLIEGKAKLGDMPVRARLPIKPAQAGRSAAGALFRNPVARKIPVVGNWLMLAGMGEWIWDEINKRWMMPDDRLELSDGREYKARGGSTWHLTKGAACASFVPNWDELVEPTGVGVYVGLPNDEDCEYKGVVVKDGRLGPPGTIRTTYDSLHSRDEGSCPAGSWVSEEGCFDEEDLPRREVEESEFVDTLDSAEIPDDVYEDFDNVKWPVGLPEIEPTFIPTGDPVPNTNHNPSDPESQPWSQPGRNVTPANDTRNPWRTDVRPWNKPVPGPEPNREPEGYGDPGEWGGSGQPPGGGSPDVVGLCDQYPDISACAKLGTEDPEELPEEEIEIEIDPQDFGPEDGTCPAPIVITVFNHEFDIEYTPICDLAEGVRPLVIAFAWLCAALAVGGWGRSSA